LFFSFRVDWDRRYARLAEALQAIRRIFFKYCVDTVAETAPTAVRVSRMDEGCETALISWQAAAAGYGMVERRDVAGVGLEAARDSLFARMAAAADFAVEEGTYRYFLERFTLGHERFGRLGASLLAYYLANYITGNERWDEYGILAREDDEFVPELSALVHWHRIAINNLLAVVFNGKKVDLFWHAFAGGRSRGIIHAEERMQYDFEEVLLGLSGSQGGQ